MLKRALFIISLSGCFLSTAKAQLANTGEKIFIDNNAVVFVSGDYKHIAGNVFNKGKITIQGDWFNNDPGSTVFDSRSVGLTDLTGGNQHIGGSNKTTFSDLNLSGNGNKTLTADIDVTQKLFLNDKELKADQYTISVLNPLNDAIFRSTGFVSTDQKGKLIRNTNNTDPYVFPLGSSLSASPLYRPVSVEPLNSDINNFAITFLDESPSNSGYNTTNKREDIDLVFDQYYYILNQESGSSTINAKFYQQTSGEDTFTQLVNWNNSSNLWEKAAPSTVSDGIYGDGLNRTLLFKSLDVLKNLPVTFATSASVNDPLTFFNGFSPDGDGKNDTWVIKNIDLFPDNELRIFNRWGDEVFKAKGYNLNNAWNGTNMNSGTYFYVLKVNISGAPKVYKGFITMLKKD